MVNIVNIAIGNYSKSSLLRCGVVAPNNGSYMEDSLEGMSSLVNDSQQASVV